MELSKQRVRDEQKISIHSGRASYRNGFDFSNRCPVLSASRERAGASACLNNPSLLTLIYILPRKCEYSEGPGLALNVKAVSDFKERKSFSRR